MDAVQLVQSKEYSFPYHYLPRMAGRGFHSYRDWDWSLQYMTALSMVSDKIASSNAPSHIDIGCGDGALLAHLSDRIAATRFVGVDYDEHAIALARMMAPNVEFIATDIINNPPPQKFHSGSMIEVFEHIPPEIGREFLLAARDMLLPGAKLFLTVPHSNKPLIDKHYRHFTFDLLSQCISPIFEIREMFAFEKETLLRKVCDRLRNRYFFAEVHTLNRRMLEEQLRLTSHNEAGFQRIFAELIVPDSSALPSTS